MTKAFYGPTDDLTEADAPAPVDPRRLAIDAKKLIFQMRLQSSEDFERAYRIGDLIDRLLHLAQKDAQ